MAEACQFCGSDVTRARNGRPGKFCTVRCRVAAMRRRKLRAGLIPRAPWSEAGRAAYYERQERANRYPNPNRKGVDFHADYAAYMAKWHPTESPILGKYRNAGPATGAGNVTQSGAGNVTRAGAGNESIL